MLINGPNIGFIPEGEDVHMERDRRKLVIDGNGTEKVIFSSASFPDKHIPVTDYASATAFLKEARRLTKEQKVGQKEATWVPQLEYPELPFAVSLMSDMHYGSVNTDYDLLDEHLNIVDNTPNFFMATNGDHVDNFSAVKHPTGMTEDPLPPHFQAKALFERLLELDRKAKIGVISHGNHDLFGFMGGQDFFETFASEMQCPIFTEGGSLDIVTPGYTYKMLLNHTYWGRSKINITNASKRLMEYESGDKTADIGWLGHTHQSSYEYFTKGGKDIVALVSGTYKVDDPWSAQNGIGSRAGHPGITVVFWPDRRKMEVFKDVAQAKAFIEGFIHAQGV